MKKCPICKTVVALAGIGAVNWLLTAVFKFNVVAAILGDSVVAKAVYTLVGIAGVLLLVSTFIKPCPCESKS